MQQTQKKLTLKHFCETNSPKHNYATNSGWHQTGQEIELNSQYTIP